MIFAAIVHALAARAPLQFGGRLRQAAVATVSKRFGPLPRPQWHFTLFVKEVRAPIKPTCNAGFFEARWIGLALFVAPGGACSFYYLRVHHCTEFRNVTIH